MSKKLIKMPNITFLGGCGIVGNLFYYHASNPGSIPRGGHTTRSLYLLALLGQLSLPSFQGR